MGKTNAKCSLWNAKGDQIARRIRANEPGPQSTYRALDVDGIDGFVVESLTEFAVTEDVRRIITVGHGAGAALLKDGRLFAAPMDYEDEVSDADREQYRVQRDSFADTGSPFLPMGLNLGIQIDRLENLLGKLPEDVTIVPWAQYWAWRLCGVASSEISSLGCHTDLWRPIDKKFSNLAEKRGWASRFAPIRRACDALGEITPDLAATTGLSSTCEVFCGLHDSNAALLAARGHPEIADYDATVLSTGTWFVAMRSLGSGAQVETKLLQESRDCLINVDVYGNAVPSARFMGGRESESIGGVSSFAITDNYEPSKLIGRIPVLIESGAFALPSFAKGVGPFPDSNGSWINEPTDPDDKRAVAGLYLALVADASLQLIGSRDRLLIEGRFAEAELFVRTLATLRPEQNVYVSNAHTDVAYGALRLVNDALGAPSALTAVEPLDIDLTAYAAEWRSRAQLGS